MKHPGQDEAWAAGDGRLLPFCMSIVSDGNIFKGKSIIASIKVDPVCNFQEGK